MKHCHLTYLLCTLAALLSGVPSAGAEELGLRTVVIDPGHGGKDSGCRSRDRRTYEKNVVLDIGKRLAAKIRKGYPEVKVLMTRSTDEFIELGERADIANRAGADLFISLHINSVESGTSASGYSVHCLGQSARKGNDLFDKNMALCRRENSVILLEDDYSTRYQGFDPSDPQSYIFFNLMQNAHLEQSLLFAELVNDAMSAGPIKRSRGVSQDPFLVLWRTTMPSVLIECAFITNPGDLASLRSEEHRDRIADNIYKAFRRFKASYDGSFTVGGAASADEAMEPVSPPVSMPEVSVFYGTQVLVSSRRLADSDSFFEGYRPTVVKVGSLYKYVIAVSPEISEARKQFSAIRKKFPDSFLVTVEDGKVARVN